MIERPVGVRVGAAVAIVALLAGCSGGGSGAERSRARPSAADGAGHPAGPWDWPGYGHDAQHSFAGRTTLTPEQAPTLARSWFFPTGDAVTATPTVVNGVVYVGSWDGTFYALDLATGKERWRFALHHQSAITPQPGDNPRDSTSDGGLVTSSAWYEPGRSGRPDLVLFGGGYTLYALDAATGQQVWFHDYPGRPDLPPDPAQDEARIFSSPVVVDDKVVIGVSTDGQDGHRGYVAAADLADGNPAWVHETDVDAGGKVLNDGCGSVWSSATVLPAAQLLVLDVADCNFANPPPESETVLALRVADGTEAWRFRPERLDTGCDFDFGATLNAGLDQSGRATFLGVGAKDGTYYAIDPATGMLRWQTNVVFGGFAGGFIATAAYDGRRVYGSTAIGDFGRFEGEGLGSKRCRPEDPRDIEMQEPTVHAFDAATGGIMWQAKGSASFGPTTVAGNMTFNGPALAKKVLVRDATDGRVLAELATDTACWGGIATVGDAVVFGTGSSYEGKNTGVSAYTPGGRPPSVPAR